MRKKVLPQDQVRRVLLHEETAMGKMLLVLLAGLLLAAGCAQKLPVNTGGDVGVIAIPMESSPHASLRFVYYYEISSSADKAVSIRLQPIAGRHFAFSDPIPSGKYLLDTSTTYATPYYNTITPENKQVRRLNPPIEVTIERGKVLVADHVLQVRILNMGAYSYQQVAEWKELDAATKGKFLNILSEAQGIDGWQPQTVMMRTWHLPAGDITRLNWD